MESALSLSSYSFKSTPLKYLETNNSGLKKPQLAGGNQLAIDKNPHVIHCWFLRLRMKSCDIIVINPLPLVVQNMDNVIHTGWLDQSLSTG